jgi:membrane-anchored protein YejM (alkaline phosphatase superfamily)
MPLATSLLLLAHLLAFAALLGGVLAQARDLEPQVSALMLWGGWLELVTGVALVVLAVLGTGRVAWWPVSLKLALTLFVVVLLVGNRRFLSIPRGLLALVGGLVGASAALSVLWP